MLRTYNYLSLLILNLIFIEKTYLRLHYFRDVIFYFIRDKPIYHFQLSPFISDLCWWRGPPPTELPYGPSMRTVLSTTATSPANLVPSVCRSGSCSSQGLLALQHFQSEIQKNSSGVILVYSSFIKPNSLIEACSKEMVSIEHE